MGGGLSWFGRAYGLAADSLVALEIVDADGELVRVTADSDPDLFWAIRGGGGDFGIITAAEVALHPAATIYGGRLMWPIEHAPEVLRAFQTVTAAAPDELTVWFHLLRFPPLPEIPDPSAAFTPAAPERLRAIKAERDPHGFIRSNRPVGAPQPAVRIPRQRS